MSTPPPILRWLGFGAGMGVFAVVGLLFVLCCGAVPLNQLKLRQLWSAYTEIPHPEGSVPLTRYAEVGLLDGNGNHCDFIAGEQRRSDLAAADLIAFYAPWPSLELYIPDSEEGTRYASSVVLDTPNWPAGSYAVYLFEWGHNDDFDIRCH